MIQFARRSPRFRGIRITSIKAADAPVLRAEIAVLLAKDEIEPVPPADMRSGFDRSTNLGSTNFDPCASQAAIQVVDADTHFQVCPSPRLFAAIDLKDACFRVSILPQHRAFLRFAFWGSGMSVQASAFRVHQTVGFSGQCQCRWSLFSAWS